MWFDKAKELIGQADGEVGLLVKNLATGETFLHNTDMVFPSASIIKVPILITLMDAVAEGKVDLATQSPVSPADIVGGCGIIQVLGEGLPFTLLDHATMMIDLSDNTATNQLIAVLGMDSVNAKCSELGMKDTVLGRKLMDFEAKKRGNDNYTSCRDLLVLFEHIYGNADRYALALKLLGQQMLNDLLPAGFIEHDVKFAHKTGDLGGVRHDVGIMYLKDPIFVAYLSKNFKRDNDTVRLANDIGLLLYNAYKE